LASSRIRPSGPRGQTPAQRRPHHDGAIRTIAAKTRTVPGYGTLATPDDLKRYPEMLETMQEPFDKLKAEGKTVDEVVGRRRAEISMIDSATATSSRKSSSGSPRSLC
jgi:hypothetical protein